MFLPQIALGGQSDIDFRRFSLPLPSPPAEKTSARRNEAGQASTSNRPWDTANGCIFLCLKTAGSIIGNGIKTQN